MSKPLVSICIPTYNGAQFIAEAMESVIAQTYDNLEIIVSDDASKDNTLEIIKSYRSKMTIPISIFHHKPNGIGANWNNSIKEAKGKYIKFLFQDDVLLSTCIEKMVVVLEADSAIGLVACKRDFIVSDTYLNNEMKDWIINFKDLQSKLNLPIQNGVQILDKSIFKFKEFLNNPKNKVGEPPVTLFRKSLIKKIGYYSEDLKQSLDYEFYNRILKKHKIAILQEHLVRFRLHELQATAINKDKEIEDYVLYKKIIYDDYFWYLSRRDQIKLLKKYNSFVKILVKIKRKLIN